MGGVLGAHCRWSMLLEGSDDGESGGNGQFMWVLEAMTGISD